MRCLRACPPCQRSTQPPVRANRHLLNYQYGESSSNSASISDDLSSMDGISFSRSSTPSSSNSSTFYLSLCQKIDFLVNRFQEHEVAIEERFSGLTAEIEQLKTETHKLAAQDLASASGTKSFKSGRKKIPSEISVSLFNGWFGCNLGYPPFSPG